MTAENTAAVVSIVPEVTGILVQILNGCRRRVPIFD